MKAPWCGSGGRPKLQMPFPVKGRELYGGAFSCQGFSGGSGSAPLRRSASEGIPSPWSAGSPERSAWPGPRPGSSPWPTWRSYERIARSETTSCAAPWNEFVEQRAHGAREGQFAHLVAPDHAKRCALGERRHAGLAAIGDEAELAMRERTFHGGELLPRGDAERESLP